jgi:hypothetical protein
MGDECANIMNLSQTCVRDMFIYRFTDTFQCFDAKICTCIHMCICTWSYNIVSE